MDLHIQTSGKRFFDYRKDIMDKNHIDIKDVAKALSRQPRFLGHTNSFYSVAQHCCMCHDNTDGDKLEALLHDAPEAYMCDIPSPLKRFLPDYREMEKRVWGRVSFVFGLNFVLSRETKEVDQNEFGREWKLLKQPRTRYQRLKEIFLGAIGLGKCWSPKKAEREFLKRFDRSNVSTGLLDQIQGTTLPLRYFEAHPPKKDYMVTVTRYKKTKYYPSGKKREPMDIRFDNIGEQELTKSLQVIQKVFEGDIMRPVINYLEIK